MTQEVESTLCEFVDDIQFRSEPVSYLDTHR
jgi:hypothetical protein